MSERLSNPCQREPRRAVVCDQLNLVTGAVLLLLILCAAAGCSGAVTTSSQAPVEDGWVDLAPANPPPGRWESTMVASDGLLYLFGGMTDQDKANSRSLLANDIWRYTPDINIWEEIEPPSAPPPRRAHTAVVHGRQMLVFGGYGENDVLLGDLWIYDFDQGTWEQKVPAGPPPARAYHSAGVAGDLMVICGGIGAAGNLTDTWVYDVAANTWRQGQSFGGMPTIAHSTPMISGADTVTLVDPRALWVYNPTTDTGTFVYPAEPLPGTTSLTAYAQYNGLLYIAGGQSREGKSDETWRYDPNAGPKGEWVKLSSLPEALRSPAAAFSADGEMLLFGGVNSGEQTMGTTLGLITR